MTTEESKEITTPKATEEAAQSVNLSPEMLTFIDSTLEKILTGIADFKRVNTRVEQYIVFLGAGIVTLVGIVSIIASCQGRFDTAESLLIPLLSFAGGLGIGSRMTRDNQK